MAYCKNCGSQLSESETICSYCGHSVDQQSQYGARVDDNGGFGWGLLGFCIPIVGLVLFLIWNKDRPRTAKAALIGAVIGFVVNIFTSIMLLLA